MMKKVAVMQPYFFPYLGYFQLINAVDTFVFYDDVNYIKRGWINRNYILINTKAKLLTIPCKNVSQNKLINEIEPTFDKKAQNKIIGTLQTVYAKAPYFDQVFELCRKVLTKNYSSISQLAIHSVLESASYIGIDTEFKISSEAHATTIGLDRAERLIEITKREEGSIYVNSINGRQLYEKEYFSNSGIELFFLKPELPTYPHFNGDAEPGLSMIDVMMFNAPDQIQAYLKEYTLQ